MLKRFLALALMASAVCAYGEVRTLKVDRFQQIRVVGPVNVDCIYNPDSVGYIKVNADTRDYMPWVEASTKGDKLKIQLRMPDDMRHGVIPTPDNLPSVKVYTNYLTGVSNEGDSIVRVITSTNVPSFNARLIGNGYMSVRGIDTERLTVELLSGNGTLAIHGRANSENIKLAGVGTIEADGLEAETAKVVLVGTGNIGVWAKEKLTVRGTGTGTVYLKGTPEVTKKLALGIKLQPID